MVSNGQRWFHTLLAWYFVSVWGSGFIATKIALQHAAPFTFLSIRFAFGITCFGVALLARRAGNVTQAK